MTKYLLLFTLIAAGVMVAEQPCKTWCHQQFEQDLQACPGHGANRDMGCIGAAIDNYNRCMAGCPAS